MARLGSIYEDTPASGPRGRDLRCSVVVPRAALGKPEGYEVRVPLRLPCEGAQVLRASSPHDAEDRIRLHLPAQLPPKATLRLRGQGEELSGGAAGDLLLTVEVRSPSVAGSLAVAGLILAVATAAGLWLHFC